MKLHPQSARDSAATLVLLVLTLFCAPALAAASAGDSSPAAVPTALDAPAGAAPASSASSAAAAGVPTAPDSTVAKSLPFPLGAVPLSPMMQAIKAAWEESEATRLRLTEAVDRAPNATEALKAQRALEGSLRDFEIRVLRIQGDYARLEGNAAKAEEIEAAIRRILSPPDLRKPADRPAPAGAR
jgi:hypothetical protein